MRNVGIRIGLVVFAITVVLGVLFVPGCPPAQDSGQAVGLLPVAGGFTAPVALVEPPDGSHRLFVVDQIGLIRVIGADGIVAATPFLDVRDRMVALATSTDERGLLCLAFHPEYATNRRLFVVYNAPPAADANATYDNEWRLSEFRVSPDDPGAALPDSERVLLRVGMTDTDRIGGQLAFGPDGYLYVSVGDGGLTIERETNIGTAQDLATLRGKLLRIDVNGDDGNGYAVPPDNPFVGRSGVRPEIWASGFRNPWRFSFDAGGTRLLLLADVGARIFEEVDIIQKGGNYGWPIREGVACFDPTNPSVSPENCPEVAADGAPLLDPILQMPHRNSAGLPVFTAIIGGYVYRGTAIDTLAGDYVFGDYTALRATAGGELYAAHEEADGSWTQRRLQVIDPSGGSFNRFVLAFGQDLEGELYVLTSGAYGPTGSAGEVYKLVPSP